jgi:NAD(P)-dependent dehydrogenase (short-subunit alcohol dehydrogenase family)
MSAFMATVLVTDTHLPLGIELAKSFLQRGWNVLAAPSDKPEDDSRRNPYAAFKKKPLAVVPWNRPSPLSSKNLILQGRQKFKSLEAALILVPPLPPASPFAELRYLDVETVLDVWLKGSILLARDLVAHFAEKKAGALAFVGLSLPKSGGNSPLDDLCRESLLVVWKGLVRDARSSGLCANAFLSRSGDARAYAEFVGQTFVEKCNKANGKLFYFQWK